MHRGDDFGDDAERDLRRAISANVETDRYMHAGELLFSDSLFAQHLQNCRAASSAAEEADIRRLGGEHALENGDVDFVVVRGENDGSGWTDLELRRDHGHDADAKLAGSRKAFAIGELRTA